MNKHVIAHAQAGYVLLVSTVLFISLAFLLVVAIITPLVTSKQAATGFVQSSQAFLVGNSAVEEALYRLRNGYQLQSTEIIELGDATATIQVSSGSDEKTIRVDTDNNDFFRNLETEVSIGAGVSFNYGLQAGRGGFEMAGGARVNGNVYSNGDVIGSGGPEITGGAIVANRSNANADQTSTGPETPPADIAFGGDSTPEDVAQSFTVATTTPITSVRLYLLRTTEGWMNDVTLRITEDDGGSPHKTTLATANIDTGQITMSYNYFEVPLSSTLALNPGETYWIVLDTSTTWGDHYSLGAAADAYPDGTALTGEWHNGNGGTWDATSPANLDMYFDVYVGGDTGLLRGVTVGQADNDLAWAHRVEDSTVGGIIYCKTSENNNKPCNTDERDDPTEKPFPISDGNIEDWKTEAEAGGTITGNVSYGGSDTDAIGPTKIEGDLSLTSGAEIEVLGTLYVTGDISVSGGSKLYLSSAYGTNPGTIVSDGTIAMTGGGIISGTGNPDSYVLVITTSDCPDGAGCGSTPAIEVSGGTDSIILNAQKGAVKFSGGAIANQVTGRKVIMSGGTEIYYLEGIADVNFSSGPSGSWTIDSWQEI